MVEEVADGISIIINDNFTFVWPVNSVLESKPTFFLK